MSDSDSTCPATDDFGSRFLEFDAYEDDAQCVTRVTNSGKPVEPVIYSPVGTKLRRSSRDARPSLKRSSENGTRRARKVRSYVAMEEGRSDISDHDEGSQELDEIQPIGLKRPRRTHVSKDENVEDHTLEEFRAPKLLTARQLSLQQRSGTRRSIIDKVQSESALLSLECLEPAKARNSMLTPEQLAARQLSIVRRRESAKHKAELEKRLTVERLLKINTDCDSFQRGLKFKGRGSRSGLLLSHSVSATSLPSVLSVDDSEHGEYQPISDEIDDESIDLDSREATFVEELDDDKNDEDSKADPQLLSRIALGYKHALDPTLLDPPPNYVRYIMSARLCPVNRVSFHPLVNPTAPHDPPKEPQSRQLCALGCGRPRRYACSTTGRSLCSLVCYKANLIKSVAQVK